MRKELNSKKITFKDICVSESLRLRAKNIVPCAHWITPTIEPKRFDTRFFLAKVDFKQLASHDGFELTESFWIKPMDALKKFQNGEMNMILPTIKNIEKLAEFSSSTEASNYFNDLGNNAITAILPKFIKRDEESFDKERYQTIYAKHEGAVAAPTAGMHFSKHLLKLLKF